MITFRILGTNEMVRSFEKMNAETQSRIRTEFETVAKNIEQDAKHNAPVSHKPHHEGGTLRRSIKSKVEGSATKMEARIGTDTYYAIYQEEGTRGSSHRQVRGQNASSFVHAGGIPALHYLKNAYDKNAPALLAALESIIHSLRW